MRTTACMRCIVERRNSGKKFKKKRTLSTSPGMNSVAANESGEHEGHEGRSC